MANGKIGFFLTKFREARANKKMWKNIRKKARKHKSWKKIKCFIQGLVKMNIWQNILII